MVLDEEQGELQRAARAFARERLSPDYVQRERDEVLDRELLREMGRLGLLAIDMPVEHGGLGVCGVTAGLVAEELAHGDFNVSCVSVIGSLAGAILVKNAPAHVVAQWVPAIVTGEKIVGIAVTEPRGGSDAANLQLRARRAGSGQKHTAEAAMVKWMGPKTSFDVIHQCLLTYGHYGWSKDSPHQQRMRDVMGSRSGTEPRAS